MAQDEGQLDPPPDDSDGPGSARNSSIWPWLAMAAVVIIVILFLWMFWRQPRQSTSKTQTETVQSIVVLPAARPEPVVPQAAIGSSPTPTGAAPLVPDVLGDPKNSAVSTIERAGYAASVSETHIASKASGMVIRQNPAGGTELDSGGVVSIVVSASNITREVKMPRIVGLSQAAAESKVEAAGLVPYIMYGSSNVPNGQVISQWPPAGDLLPAGSEGFIQVQLNP
jgi:hypothetical protein